MYYRPYDRIEQRILNADTGSSYYRWKWGRLVLCDPDLTKNGRLRHGVLDALVAKAWAHGSKLSKREIKYRLQAARTYQTEAEIGQVLAQFDNWWTLISAGFPPAEVPPDAPGDGLFDTSDTPDTSGESENPAEGPQPYDPRPPYKQRDDAMRQIDRILNSPEANGQEPLFGLRMFLPGFTPDTVGRETLFREAFKLSRYIREEVTPKIRTAADQAERDDDERDAKLNRLYDAIGRNPEASLGEGDDAYWAAQDPPASDE
jgi:hypothetical protein